MPVRLEDLSPADQTAVRVGRLFRHARTLSEAGDPGAIEAEAAYVAARVAGEEAGLLMRRIELCDLRDRHALVEPDAELTVGVGWQPLVEDALGRLADLHVRVPLIREKFGGLDVKVWSASVPWFPGEMARVDPAMAPACEAALRTCEACGAPGTMRTYGRWRTRCDAHVNLE